MTSKEPKTAETLELKKNNEAKKMKKNKKVKNQRLKKTSTLNHDEEDDEQKDEGYPKSDDRFVETEKDAVKGKEEIQDAAVDEDDGFEEQNRVPDNKQKKKKKEKLLKRAAKADNRGVCYLSRVPPHMDHVKLRQLLSQYGEILRIYLTPSVHPPQVKGKRPRPSKVQEQEFSEGWVEFARKGIAKRVANMLNGEQIGGKKRSSFYYDLWNIKYLSKFKWDDLTEEIAYKSAIREQKLALEISAAKRERDFYLSKVDQARALSSIEERMKKKQKMQQESGRDSELPAGQKKVVRQFPQNKPVAVDTSESKPRLSKDILSGVSVTGYATILILFCSSLFPEPCYQCSLQIFAGS
ncbi:hypothetical protein DITRI_Ditri16bG0138600 [Diplodiscus trichospermus]